MTRIVKIFWKVFFIGLLTGFLFLLLINWGVFGKMPSLAELENPTMSLATEVFAEDGQLMGRYYTTRSNRTHVKYSEISKTVIDALVSTEDERFYNHAGIDGKALLRAVTSFGTDGGASTITQQLALNMFEEPRSKNKIKRVFQKLKENIIAIKLERNFTKEEILALYLNTVPFSDNVLGIKNASRTFFSKDPGELSYPEAAVLIGMLKGPSLYNPRTKYQSALNRRNTVLSQMVRNDVISSEEAEKFKKDSIILKYKKTDQNNGIAPYFLDVMREELKTWASKNYKSDGTPYNIYTDGLKIYTTINPTLQLYAEEAVAKHLPVLQRALEAQNSVKKGTVWKGRDNILEAAMKNSDRWKNMKEDSVSEADIRKSFNQKVPMKVFAWNSRREKDTVMTPMDSIKYHRAILQTAFMAMDPVSGAVKAWVGGVDFKNFKYDHVNLRTKRQVGSTIKPFLYALAVEEYGFTPETECEDRQQFFPPNQYVPARDRGHNGTRTMANALAWSVNEVAAYIIKQTTPERFAKFIGDINIPTKVEPYPSISLGSCDLSLFEMMWGYTMFPSGGFSTKPIYITRIEDKNGNVLASFDTERKEVINERTAYTMNKMMQGVVDYGTAAGLRNRIGVVEMGGKTGTTNDNSDAWFMGFTPELLAGVWIGCDDRFIRLESNLGYGGAAARPIWETFFSQVVKDKTIALDKSARFPEPQNMTQEVYYDMSVIEHVPPPGAEGQDVGNGRIEDYLGVPDKQNIPLESKQAQEELKILQEALNPKNQPKEKKADTTKKEPEEKKKTGFFKRVFKGKENKDN